MAKQNATMEEIEVACKKANIHEYIQSLPNGYKTMVEELGSSLSGGERQRIGLARMFMKKEKIRPLFLFHIENQLYHIVIV